MKTNLYKIGIWGQYGDGGPIADGQAVRTTITTQELIKKYGEKEVLVLNTNAWRKHPVRFFIDTINLLRKCENVLILPADNGLRIVAPIYDFFNKLYKRRLLYIVIGGFLPAFLQKHPRYIRMLNKYEALFVQTPNIKKDLSELGILNIEMMTNFKVQSIRLHKDIEINQKECVDICILSRLAKDKGIEDAIEATKLVNQELGGHKIHLDLYGIVPDNYKERFEEIILENSDFVTYKGIANYNHTVSVLKDYFLLLFPTYFHGEGFAGCLIDAFFAGIPVIATDWLYNKDVIIDNKNGILVPIKSPRDIANAILRLYKDRDLAFQISLNNVEEANNYTPEKVLNGLYKYLDS